MLTLSCAPAGWAPWRASWRHRAAGSLALASLALGFAASCAKRRRCDHAGPQHDVQPGVATEMPAASVGPFTLGMTVDAFALACTTAGGTADDHHLAAARRAATRANPDDAVPQPEATPGVDPNALPPSAQPHACTWPTGTNTPWAWADLGLDPFGRIARLTVEGTHPAAAAERDQLFLDLGAQDGLHLGRDETLGLERNARWGFRSGLLQATGRVAGDQLRITLHFDDDQWASRTTYGLPSCH